MPDYQSLNLSSLCNVGAEIIGENATPAMGTQNLPRTALPDRCGRELFSRFRKPGEYRANRHTLNASPKRVIVVHRCSNRRFLRAIPSGV